MIRADRATAVLAFLLILTIYLLTLPPDLTGSHHGYDAGDLITASVTGGIPHPTGYPTYALLSQLFSHLPLGTIAYRFNLFSAVCTALAASLLIYQLSIINYQLSTAAGLTFAFFPLVWSQAIITEVYALNLLVIALFLGAMDRDRRLLAPFFFGLALTTHLTSLFLLPLLIRHLRPLRPRQWGHALLSVALGLTPLLLLPLRAQSDSPVIWGDPTTLDGWWWLISGQIYHANAFAFPADQWLARLAEWHAAGLWQIWLLVFVLGYWDHRIIGSSDHRLIRLSDDPSTPLSHYPIILVLLAYFLYALTYNAPDAIVLTLPAIYLLCRQLPAGLMTLTPRLPRNWTAVTPLLLPLLLLLLNFTSLTLRHENTIRPQAEQLLQQAPPHAILLTPGDQTLFALWYYHHVEGQRPDLIVVDGNLFAFDWYRARLARLHPDLTALAADDLTQFEQVNQTQRPFCHASFNTTPTLTC